MFKPVTSKPGNSEVYVVASGFDGINPHLLSQLVDHVGMNINCNKNIRKLS